jgi:ribosomal-protein-alanine N-acetyltransferase
MSHIPLPRSHALPEGCVVREMTPADLPGVLEIENEINETPWGVVSFETAMEYGDITLVVTHEEKIVAFAVLKLMWIEAEILNIGVHPDYRRLGIGRFLVWRLVQLATQNGAAKVFLEVRVSNINAQQMYLKEKFEFFSRRKNYYRKKDGGQEDALLMLWVQP